MTRSFENFLDSLPDFAKDIKLNTKSVVLSETSHMTQNKIAMIALTCAMTLKNKAFFHMISDHFSKMLTQEEINACKAAAAIMGMNNIYYRFTHVLENTEYQGMPVGLRMNVMANPGISHVDFELISLAASSITGCSLCMDSHEKKLKVNGVSAQVIQHSVKIAALIHALLVIFEQESL